MRVGCMPSASAVTEGREGREKRGLCFSQSFCQAESRACSLLNLSSWAVDARQAWKVSKVLLLRSWTLPAKYATFYIVLTIYWEEMLIETRIKDRPFHCLSHAQASWLRHWRYTCDFIFLVLFQTCQSLLQNQFQILDKRDICSRFQWIGYIENSAVQ